MPVRKYCAVYILRFELLHGMEEVIGSIPIRSTDHFNNIRQGERSKAERLCRGLCHNPPFCRYWQRFPSLYAWLSCGPGKVPLQHPAADVSGNRHHGGVKTAVMRPEWETAYLAAILCLNPTARGTGLLLFGVGLVVVLHRSVHQRVQPCVDLRPFRRQADHRGGSSRQSTRGVETARSRTAEVQPKLVLRGCRADCPVRRTDRQSSHAARQLRRGRETKASLCVADTPSKSRWPVRLPAWPVRTDKPPAPAESPSANDRREAEHSCVAAPLPRVESFTSQPTAAPSKSLSIRRPSFPYSKESLAKKCFFA